MLKRILFFCVAGLIGTFPAMAQSGLDRNITFSGSEITLRQALDSLSIRADVRFSYNSRIVQSDSLVWIRVMDASLESALRQLFDDRYLFLGHRNYVIIRYAPERLTLVPGEVEPDGNGISVYGRVLDQRTGLSVPNASVYDNQFLAATLTDRNGHFVLRYRTRRPVVSLTVSKERYADVSLLMHVDGVIVEAQAGSESGVYPGDEQADRIGGSFLGRLFLSSRQRLQTMNLRGFLAEQPYQISLTPGLSTHGLMSGQIVDRVSLNLIGGYTAGVNGLEMAGVFNINRGDVRYVQGAGVFNQNGGSVHGVQLAGLFNNVLGSVHGVQGGGLFNYVGGSSRGLQLSGLYNQSNGAVQGVQAAGLLNRSRGVRGYQMSGAVNWADGDVRGLQASGFLNKANVLRGVQFGIINVADSSAGASVGIINIIRKNGYYSVTLAADEAQHLSVRTGTHRFYTILMAGIGLIPDQRQFMYGFGIGTSVAWKERWLWRGEFTTRRVYLGDWRAENAHYTMHFPLEWQLHPHISLFAGPSVNLWYSDQKEIVSRYADYSGRRAAKDLGKGWKLWPGFGSGLRISI